MSEGEIRAFFLFLRYTYIHAQSTYSRVRREPLFFPARAEVGDDVHNAPRVWRARVGGLAFSPSERARLFCARCCTTLSVLFVLCFFPFAATILTLCSAASVCLQSAVWLIGQGQWDARGAAIYTHRRGGRECVIESGLKVCFFSLAEIMGLVF